MNQADKLEESLRIAYNNAKKAQATWDKSHTKAAYEAHTKLDAYVVGILKDITAHCKETKNLDLLFKAEMLSNDYDREALSSRERDKDSANKQLNETNGAFHASQTVKDTELYKALRSSMLLKADEKTPADGVTAYFEKRLRQLNLENGAKLSPERYANLSARMDMIKLSKEIYNEKQMEVLQAPAKIKEENPLITYFKNLDPSLSKDDLTQKLAEFISAGCVEKTQKMEQTTTEHTRQEQTIETRKEIENDR